MAWDVQFHPDAVPEVDTLLARDIREYTALQTAIEKLEVYGDRLPPPHTGNVRGADRIWELRPRQGRSQWRAFYRRIGPMLVIGAIGPEAESDRKGFDRAVMLAEARLNAIEQERSAP